jgi:hypothetical protein
MTCHECIAGLMVRHGMMGTRPNGFKIVLARTNFVYMIGNKRLEPARFRASDLLAEDWEIHPAPPEHRELPDTED